jgi:hypothetical protein
MVMTGDAGVLGSAHGRVMTRTRAGQPPQTTIAERLAARFGAARRLRLCTVPDGSIAEAVGYRSGEWDDELRARHALEAPMVRP